MPFASVFFLFAFLPIFLSAYYLAPRVARNWVALAGSLLFYAWGAPRFVFVLIGVSGVDYVFSRRIASAASNSKRRKLLLAVAVSLNLSLLFYFKYANFVVHQSNDLFAFFGRGPIAWQDIALPMGVSFVVFEEISYLVDVYRETARPASRFLDYALFLSLFPHSIAGPIFRWRDLAEQLRARTHSLDAAFDGFLRFCFGLGKKVLVANQVAAVADKVFGHDIATLPTSYAWLGMLAYTLQIYFDFSGYSDMAIGLGKMMGFSFKENFDAPYSSASITEFWRRWHISLSSWLRDYLYIPLGGSREGTLKQYRNLVIVFLCCGFWHGANWTFFAWGAYHGAWLIIERTRVWQRLSRGLPRVAGVLLTFLVVMFGWVLFRSESLAHAWGFLRHLVSLHPAATSGTIISWGELISNRAAVFGALGLVGCFATGLPEFETWCAWFVGKRRAPNESALGELVRWLGAAGALSLAVLSLVNSNFNPFIYFRF
ncbi:MAG TPA: MBOAT family protein [Polyangiaceae bacterium]|jgi:alginate O-acetyltransferase complex protein AlgI|nr:MBOAT family protein [Polyangiaceae bacterium]